MVRQLIVGSTAMWSLGLVDRFPKDFDAFSPDDPTHDAEAEKPVEFLWHESFEDWIPEGTNRFATLDELYTIKVSHSYWELPNGSWNKHIHDAWYLKTKHGAKLDMGLHQMLYKVWEEKHGTKKCDLTKEADEFFGADAVHRIYDHDSIHYSVAYGERPLYEGILRDGHSVDVDPAKLWALSHEDLVRLFREEIYATALERILIPKKYAVSPGAAYLWALRRTITSLTKGKSARFTVENFGDFRKPEPDYLARHLSKKHLLVKLEVG